MDYYLYSHSNADGIFYIGKGCNDRFKDKLLLKRSDEWHKASKDGYTSKIEANGTEADILSLEKIVIKSLVEQGVNLVNKFHNPNWRRIHSNKTKKKMSDAKIGIKKPNRCGKNHPNFGTKRPDNVYMNKKRSQHFKLAKANNFRRTL